MFKLYNRVWIKEYKVHGNIIEIYNDDKTRPEYYLVEVSDEDKKALWTRGIKVRRMKVH